MVLKDARNLRDIRNLRNKYHQGFGSTGKGVVLEQQDWDSDPDLTQSSHTIAMLEEQELETEYPQIQKIEQMLEKYSKRNKSEYLLSSSSTAVSNYQPPQDSMMGPPGYPPATGQTAIPIPQRPAYGNGVPRFNNFRRDPKNEWWNLPSAMHQTGAIFVPGSSFQERYPKVLKQLHTGGIIGEDPMKLWTKNQITCKLDLKNPDFIIDDKPMKHITPAMKQSFQKHIDQLLELKVIRPSKSRHRTTAFIVQSGTYIDPITKEEKRGKERMVCNYKTHFECDCVTVPSMSGSIHANPTF